jgi:protein-S-isoprenylcysteine O-methyltransferase Ste14
VEDGESTPGAVRINAEEQLLVTSFGPAYADYRGRTRRLIPFVY